MTLKDLIDISTKMGIDPDKPIEVLHGYDFVSRLELIKSGEGGLYIIPKVRE